MTGTPSAATLKRRPTVLQREVNLMPVVARRVAVAIGSFALTWIAASLLAGWLFGSGNILVWVLAAAAGVTAYAVAPLRTVDR